MNITVKFFATLRGGRGKVQVLEVEEPTTTRDIISHFNIPEEDVAILLINGRDGDLDRPLNNEDVLSIFPPVGGG
jgi:molybdopterin converting factor small subunit